MNHHPATKLINQDAEWETLKRKLDEAPVRFREPVVDTSQYGDDDL